MHPFVLIYSIVALVASSFLYLFSGHSLGEFALGFVMFIPAGLFVLMNFRENMYPIYLFIRKPDWVRIKKRIPIFDRFLIGAMVFAVFADITAKPVVMDSYAFYAGAVLNMLWSVLDLTTRDALERHPIIWRKPYR